MSKCCLLGTDTKRQVSGCFILEIKAVWVHSKLSANIKGYKSPHSLLVGRLIGSILGFYFCLFTISTVQRGEKTEKEKVLHEKDDRKSLSVLIKVWQIRTSDSCATSTTSCFALPTILTNKILQTKLAIVGLVNIAPLSHSNKAALISLCLCNRDRKSVV